MIPKYKNRDTSNMILFIFINTTKKYAGDLWLYLYGMKHTDTKKAELHLKGKAPLFNSYKKTLSQSIQRPDQRFIRTDITNCQIVQYQADKWK